MFGEEAVKLRMLTDSAGLFRRNERDKIEDALDRFSEKFPQLFLAVYTKNLGKVADLRPFGFWVLNRGEFVDLETTKQNEGGVVIVIDPDSKAAGICFGYLLDPYLEDDDSFECLSRAHSHWLEGRYCDGLLKTLKHLETLLAKRSRQAVRGFTSRKRENESEGARS